jgi:RNA polymerase sigma-70 factor (ECF subfamily)
MDEQTFLVRVHAELDRAYRLAGLLLERQDGAEDVTHDAVISAWRSLSTLRDENKFQPWFDRIVINACRDRLRRERRIRFVKLDAAASVATTDDPFDAMLRADAALEALARLDMDLRVVLVLRYWADLSVDQIAERLAIPSGTVKSRLNRGLKRIRRDIGDRSPAEALT